MQFWETPAKLQGGSQQDDLIYYVLRKQFQVNLAIMIFVRDVASICQSRSCMNAAACGAMLFESDRLRRGNACVQTGETALLVRRKTKSLPPDLCAKGQVERISWVDTVLLNLVLQIAFRLTVTISRCCKDALLQNLLSFS